LALIRRLIFLPTSAGVRTWVECVAPLIGLPSRSHWYSNVGLGDHRPVIALRVSPTRAFPRMPGRDASRNLVA
jgi:hypothetical protein